MLLHSAVVIDNAVTKMFKLISSLQLTIMKNPFHEDVLKPNYMMTTNHDMQ